jgi:hypothetical protein
MHGATLKNKGYFVLSQQRFKNTVLTIPITFFSVKKSLHFYQTIYLCVYLIIKIHSNYLTKEHKVTGCTLFLLT